MTLRADLKIQISEIAKEILDETLGESVTYTYRDKTAITVTALPGPEEKDLALEMGVSEDETARTFFIPGQPGFLSRVSNKALTTNVVTLTTELAHGFVIGQLILITLDTADSVFDGQFIIVAVPTTTTFTYAKTNANVTSVADLGIVETIPKIGDSITYDGATWEVRRITGDGLRAGLTFDCVKVHSITLGVP